ncbi:hypothetical protein [Nitrincola sp. MINF-07-Sa-05]|uniref:hypothetical protein n=1 Tax=Nitrincola salilacus TaxID=3400273 RepID=UPI003918218F
MAARKKLKPSAYQELNQLACNTFYDHATFQRWHGRRLFAVDGSTVELPNTDLLRET